MKPIATERLELLPATLEIVSADLHRREDLQRLLRAEPGPGWPPPLISVEVMQRLKQALLDKPRHEGWSTWYAVLKQPRLLIGLGGFKGPPRNGSAELGYTLISSAHGKGLGTELVHGLTQWAFAHPEVTAVCAETLPELMASRRVLERNGFSRTPFSSEQGVIRFERRKV